MTQELTIYFTSDVHGYFYPTDFSSNEERDLGLFKCCNQFTADGNTLCLDGGDNLQGSPLAGYCHEVLQDARPLANWMNRGKYNLLCLGNHDFNYGMAYQKEFVDALQADVTCVNLRDPRGKQPYPERIVSLENGLRIGVVGLVTDSVPVWEKEENLAGYQITDAVAEARQALARLQGKVDLTIGIYHGGFERDLTTGEVLSQSKENRAFELAHDVNFDILLTGHQHMHVEGRDLFGTFVVQPDCNAREFVRLHVTWEEGQKHISSRHCSAKGVPAACHDPDLDRIYREAQAWLDEELGHLPAPLLVSSHLDMALHGSPLADFYNQIQRAYTGAQLSATSLANEVRGIPQLVHRRDLLIAYPYSNTLVKIEVTGAILRQAMERSASYFDLDDRGHPTISDRFLKPKVEHYNYDYYAGVEYSLDLNQPLGHRIRDLKVEGQPVHDRDHFTMCLNSYRASGTGGYAFYRDCPVLSEYGKEMGELLVEFFEEQGGCN